MKKIVEQGEKLGYYCIVRDTRFDTRYTLLRSEDPLFDRLEDAIEYAESFMERSGEDWVADPAAACRAWLNGTFNLRVTEVREATRTETLH